MNRLLARLELIEATGVLEIDVGWVNGNYQRILFHSVRTASADRMCEMAAPAPAPRPGVLPAPSVARHARPSRRHVRQAPRPQSQAGRSPPRRHAQGAATGRRPDRSPLPPAPARCFLDPDVGDDELRARLLSTVSEGAAARGPVRPGELDAGRPEGPLRADGRAARRAEPVRRAYREHRAAGRRGVPPDAPLDFAPTALQPLIHHDGVTDRRRWESALFLKVRDEIQTGNLAIDGAKNFGRFEAFFLPAAQWERVREAFWARTGFPVDPGKPPPELCSGAPPERHDPLLASLAVQQH